MCRRSMMAPVMDLHCKRVALPRLSPLVAVVVPIALGDLALLVLRLARGTPPLRGRFVRTMCGSSTGGWSLPCVMSD
jgi:hypothetical protein